MSTTFICLLVFAVMVHICSIVLFIKVYSNEQKKNKHEK